MTPTANRVTTSRAITSANQWTPWVTIYNAPCTVLVQGTFSGTVTLQMRGPRQAGSDLPWAGDADGAVDVKTWTAPVAETSFQVGGGFQVRLGCKTAEFTSGTANIWLGGGDPV